jgi:exonuclease III
MKIVAWNCNGAFRHKVHHVLALSPDIIVVPECEQMSKWGKKLEQLTNLKPYWFGDSGRGVGVFVHSASYVEQYVGYDPTIQYCIPLHIDGPQKFNLLAVWTKVHSDPKMSYIGQLYLAVQHYQEFLRARDTLVVGDFNANAIWDRPFPYHNLVHVAKQLDEAGLTSYYHHSTGENFGQESRNTFFMHKNPTQGYHIDYCFGPTRWLRKLKSFTVADFSSWVSLSDHCPIVIEVDL